LNIRENHAEILKPELRLIELVFNVLCT